MNLPHKINYVHLFFISLLAIHYVIPLIFIGQVGVVVHDNLDFGVVYDHIISKIYKGNIESLGYFLSGEIKWYNIERLLLPINILHYFLNEKFFYFTVGILQKLLAYFSFYILAKSLSATKFDSALGGLLYASIITFKIPLSFGIALLPYILYLLSNKNTLTKKHYFFLFLIGLNSWFVQDFFVFIFMIPLSFLLKRRSKNFIIYAKVLSIILIGAALTGIYVVIGTLFGAEEIHRAAFVIDSNGFISTFIDVFGNIFFGLQFFKPLFIFDLPLAFLVGLLLILSLFSNEKKIRLILFFVIFILISKTILDLNFINNIFAGILADLNGYAFFSRMDRFLSLVYPLLFILLIGDLILQISSKAQSKSVEHLTIPIGPSIDSIKSIKLILESFLLR